MGPTQASSMLSTGEGSFHIIGERGLCHRCYIITGCEGGFYGSPGINGRHIQGAPCPSG